MLPRSFYLDKLTHAVEAFPVTAVVGPRQSGKTTLARTLSQQLQLKGPVHYFDLEYPPDVSRLSMPLYTLEKLEGLVIIDEIQRMPELFPLLRVFVDRQPRLAHFLILGSASGALLNQCSESLAGRICFIETQGFGIHEIKEGQQDTLWLRGGFPNAFLAASERASFEWRQQFLQTFLERDLPSLGSRIPSTQLWRFWQMAAHYHGQIWNSEEIARSLGLSSKTVKHYVDLLTDTFMVRQLPPWFENAGKRTVKSPKFYVRDPGLLHALFNIVERQDLERHPKLGASWEGFALEQILRLTSNARNAFFWATHGGAELDLLLTLNGQRFGIEFKYATLPKITKSIQIALKDLQLKKIFIVSPLQQRYSLNDFVEVIPLGALCAFFTGASFADSI